MSPITPFTVFVVLIVISYSAAVPVFDDLFSSFTRSSPHQDGREVEIVKRGVLSENSDATLKQVSLQSLIGDIEQSLFQSAQSVSSIVRDENALVPQVPGSLDAHSSSKRHTEALPQTPAESATEPMKILLQTTEKIPPKVGQPAHILIDRVSVQEHHGGLPLIPPFEIQHTSASPAPSTAAPESPTAASSTPATSTGATDASKSPVASAKGATQSPSEAQIAPSASDTASESPSTTAEMTEMSTISEEASTDSSSTEATPSTSGASGSRPDGSSTTTEAAHTEIPASTRSTTTTTTTTTTTKAPIVKLKEAEQELKEKVAEIEAEPIILSARI